MGKGGGCGCCAGFLQKCNQKLIDAMRNDPKVKKHVTDGKRGPGCASVKLGLVKAPVKRARGEEEEEEEDDGEEDDGEEEEEDEVEVRAPQPHDRTCFVRALTIIFRNRSSATSHRIRTTT